jgi:hypothetical protein
MRAVIAALVLLPLAVPAVADAPRSLGEVAAQEKKKKPAKVYTEDDLRHSGRGTVSQMEGATTEGSGTAASPAPGASPAAGGEKKEGAKEGAPGEKPKSEDEIKAEKAKEWREKLTQAQADVTTWTGEVNRLQTSLNDSTAPMYGPGKQARVDALENAKKQLAAAQAAVESLQSEGRRNGF